MTIIQVQDVSDTLRYRIQVQRTLPQDDIRLTVPVTALVHSRDNESSALQQTILTALNGFVPAEWTFSRFERDGDTVGYERIRLFASARVKPVENYNLAERARRASREGLTLGPPRVDYALSPERIDEVVTALRLDVLRRVAADITQFDKQTGRSWRIGDIAFGVGDPAEYGSARTGKGAYRDPDNPMFGLEDLEPQSGLTGSERIKLVAMVTLRSSPMAWGPQDQ